MSTRRHHLDLAVAVAVVIAASGPMLACGQREPADERTDQVELQPVMADDDGLVAAVRGKYFATGDVKAQNIDVSSDNGVVTLAGYVPSEQVHQRAVSIAKEVDGVSRVDDRLQLRAEDGPSDNARTSRAADDAAGGWITTKILAQYYVNPQLKPWNIDVSTSQDGIVTLQGKVDTAGDRDEAVRIAKSTDGVKDVRNRLRAADVASTSGHTSANDVGAVVSDAWITTKIASRYFLDPDIKGRNIDIDTKDGMVVLKGTVGSYSARRQAVGIARQTDGVKEVRDELQVAASADRSTNTGRAASRAAGQVDDGWITTRIQSKYFLEGDVQGSQIDVSSRRGVVTLTGTVRTEQAKQSAVQLARDTDGVRSVRDRLTIKAADAGSR